ncbi:Ureidoglycolate hydrolase [Acidithiobacillus ferrivorans]|jgi:ureidoglycolate hydrolase|nr:Ureidoglycolate hydrolase [Acidithiobacillus ferrivorans]
MDRYSDASSKQIKIVDIKIADVCPEQFQTYGQLVIAQDDGVPYSEKDAVLDLTQGIPRLYIMRISRPYDRTINTINRHVQVTQCLASTDESRSWVILVARPSHLDIAPLMPDISTLKAFRIPGAIAIKLHHGTWHSGPYTTKKTQNFLNLELSDTNINDRDECLFDRSFGFSIRLI